VAPETTRAIYVRMSDRLARKLDRAAERLGITKRDVLSALVNNHLDGDVPDLAFGGGSSRAPRGARAGGSDADEVLTLEEAAALLRVAPADVAAMVDTGDLPGRRVGSQWRFARSAVLAWLAGVSPHTSVVP
jgi:excisionase family DNA binding protein